MAIPLPTGPSTYVIPGSHMLDPPYSHQATGTWPYPRLPGAYESECRAPGTGLIGGPGGPQKEPLALPPPAPGSYVMQPHQALGPPTFFPVVSTGQVLAKAILDGEKS